MDAIDCNLQKFEIKIFMEIRKRCIKVYYKEGNDCQY